MQIKWYYIPITFICGALICFFAMLIWSNGANGKLKSELANIRTSLDDAIATNGRLAESNRQLQADLDGANDIVAKSDIIIAGQKQTIRNQQSIIGEQQSIIDAIKRGFEEFANSIKEGFGDIGNRAIAIRDGFKKLYIIYHASTN